MKRNIFLVTISIVAIGIFACFIRYIPIFYLQQIKSPGNANFTLYKNPWYYQKNIIVSTEPFILTNLTKDSAWKWNIGIQGDVSVFPRVSVQVINADTGKVITEKNINFVSALIPAPTQQDNLVTKINNNYPHMELFPYISSTMIASYSGEPKNILITKKINIDSSKLLNELDIYLKGKSTSLDELIQKGVVFTFNKNAEPGASMIQE